MDGNVDYDSAYEDEINEAALREEYEDADYGSSHSQEDQQEAYIQKELDVITLGRAEIATLLECDNAYRCAEGGPLVPFDDILDLYCSFKIKIDDSDLLIGEVRRKSLIIAGEDLVIDELRDYFPHIEDILKFGNGHLVVAGSCPSSACCDDGIMNTVKDADFFFYDISTAEAEIITRKIVEWWFGHNVNAEDNYRVYRNENVTTLFNMTEGNRYYGLTYQIVQRCYKKKAAVITGFDLSPCQVLYDGNHIYATEMGAFSLASGYFIVDVSRRSWSFDHRIAKYANKGFTPVFITKSADEIKRTLKWKREQKTQRVNIGPTLRFYFLCNGECDIQVNYTKFAHGQTSDYDGGQDFNPHDVTTSNTLMAANGNASSIVWGGEALSDVYGPDLKVPMFPNVIDKYYWSTHFPTISLNGQMQICRRWFGKEYQNAKSADLVLEDFVLERMDSLASRVKKTFDIVNVTKGKLNWLGMDDNPSRQRFTSSIHPIEETVSWYHPAIKKTLQIGIPFETCLTLQRGWKTSGCLWNLLPKDIFRLVMRYIRASLVHSLVQEWITLAKIE